MDPKLQFNKLLKTVMKQLWFLHCIKYLQLLFMMAGAFTFLLLMASRLIVMPYLEKYLLGGLILIFVFCIIYFYRHKPVISESAVIYDRFVGDDRVLTTLSFIGHDEEIYQLQRNDAIKYMKATEQHVLKRKKKWIFSRWIMGALLLWSCAATSFLIPNDTMHAAKQKEKELEMIKKTEKKLEKVANKEKNKETKKALQEMKKELKSSNTAKEALNKLVKQNNQLELKQLKAKEQKQLLQNFQKQLHNAGLNELARALSQNDIKKMEQQLNQLKTNWNQLTNKQKQALGQITKSTKPLSKEQLAQLEKQLKNAMKLANQQKDLQLAQNSIQDSALQLQQEMMNDGLLDSNQVAFTPDNQSSVQSNQENNQAGSPSKNGQGNGQGSNNGKGSGQGQGSGTGSGNGSGSGSGQGQGGGGTGNGIGGGAGHGQGSRKFLTIPEKVSGKTNIEKDSGKLGSGNSGQQYSGNGPVLKGNVRPYEEVYGKYEQAFRESTERVKLPTELEQLVKRYFTNLNPE